MRRPGHRLADSRGYVYEHRLVAEEKSGRALVKGEQVHHVNGIRTDNRPDNLEIVASRAHHAVEHRKLGLKQRTPGEPNPAIRCECGCGRELFIFDDEGRRRRFVTGHNIEHGPDGRWRAR